MVALLILAFVGRVASPRLTDGRVLLVMGGVGTIGMLLVTAPTLLLDAAIVLVCAIACLLTAVSRTSLVLAWMTVYARLPYRPLLISYALSLVALTTVSLLIALTGGAAAIVWPLRVALPPCCACLAHVSDRSVPAREDDAVPETAWSFPLKPVLLFVAYSFVIQFTDGLPPRTAQRWRQRSVTRAQRSSSSRWASTDGHHRQDLLRMSAPSTAWRVSPSHGEPCGDRTGDQRGRRADGTGRILGRDQPRRHTPRG